MKRSCHDAACRAGLLSLALLSLAALTGCTSGLLPKPQVQAALFALDDTTPSAARAIAPPRAAASAPTLVVDAPRAAAGFDTTHIVYVRRAHEIEYFAHSEWVDAPAQMLAPLLVRALEQSGAFRAVLRAPSAAAADLRLDTELIRLQQGFDSTPSRVRLTLRAVLTDVATRRVVAAREFDASVAAPSDDPYGGVAAANLAAKRVLADLAAFCAEAAAR